MGTEGVTLSAGNNTRGNLSSEKPLRDDRSESCPHGLNPGGHTSSFPPTA